MEDKKWDATQQVAIERSIDIKERVVAVTGEAGTGKTTLMKAVHDRLVDAGYSVGLMALAGKAAKRIQEATGIKAQTIHRALEFTFPGERDEKTGRVYGISVPKRTAQNPMQFDVVLADEYAMVNQDLHRDLLNAVKPGGAVRVFGDINQLPPIEEDERNRNKPTPFQDLLDRFNGVKLTELHRTGEGSSIATNGRRILSGLGPVKTADYGVNWTNSPVKFLEQFILQASEDGIDYQSLDNQIITPRAKKCWIGSTELNAMAQPLFHESMAGAMQIERHKWEDSHPLRLMPKDKVIYVKNDYNLNVFNGETGIVQECTEAGEVVIDFGDRVVCIPPLIVYETPDGGQNFYNPQRDIQLAYIITTHKAQGSEYQHSTYLIGRAANFLLCRPNFYTAATRARKACTIITDQFAWAASLQRKKQMESYKKK